MAMVYLVDVESFEISISSLFCFWGKKDHVRAKTTTIEVPQAEVM